MNSISGNRALAFSDVDDLAFASASCPIRVEQIPVDYRPRDLGPLVEFFHLASRGRLPSPQSCILLGNAGPLLIAMER